MLSFLGEPPVAAAWTVVLVLIAGSWLGRHDAALVIAATGVAVVTTAIKVLADRPRPAAGQGLDPGFPSGHTAYVTAVLGSGACCRAPAAH